MNISITELEYFGMLTSPRSLHQEWMAEYGATNHSQDILQAAKDAGLTLEQFAEMEWVTYCTNNQLPWYYYEI